MALSGGMASNGWRQSEGEQGGALPAAEALQQDHGGDSKVGLSSYAQNGYEQGQWYDKGGKKIGVAPTLEDWVVEKSLRVSGQVGRFSEKKPRYTEDFQFDYRTAALREATMIGMPVSDREPYIEPDAFEGGDEMGKIPSIEIRPATMDDLPDIIDLASDMVVSSRSPFRPADDESMKEIRRKDLESLGLLFQSGRDCAFVARDADGVLVGHIIVRRGATDFLTGAEQAWIDDISVLPKYWGCGVSKRLLRTAEDSVRESGVNYLGLTVTVANSRALRFYERSGYQCERYQMIKILQEIDLGGEGDLAVEDEQSEEDNQGE